MTKPFTVPTDFTLTWIGCDLDRTLAYSVWPEPGIGEPIVEKIEELRQVLVEFPESEIHIFTARPWADYKLVKKWLRLHDVPFHAIVCGKPLYRIMFDDIGVNAYETNWAEQIRRVEREAVQARARYDAREHLPDEGQGHKDLPDVCEGQGQGA